MIVITAPTSRIGSQVVTAVLDAPEQITTHALEPIRLIARDPSRIPERIPERVRDHDRVEIIEGSHADPDVIEKAFKGADAVFWLVPADPRAASAEEAYAGFSRPAIDAFTRHGVQRVVGISALGRGTSVAPHAGLVTASLAMDDLIASTGVSYRALTMPSFMDNMLTQVNAIRDQDAFFLPINADLKAPACASADIAAVAARLLLDDSWSGTGSVPVLGPEDLSPNDMARIVTEVLGKTVRYQQISGEAFKSRLLGFGMSDAMAQAMADMMEAKNGGLDNGVSRAAGGTTPTTFRQWCERVLKPAIQS